MVTFTARWRRSVVPSMDLTGPRSLSSLSRPDATRWVAMTPGCSALEVTTVPFETACQFLRYQDRRQFGPGAADGPAESRRRRWITTRRSRPLRSAGRDLGSRPGPGPAGASQTQSAWIGADLGGALRDEAPPSMMPT